MNHNGSFYKFHAPLFPVLLSFFGNNRAFVWAIFSKLISLCTLLLISFFYSVWPTGFSGILLIIFFLQKGMPFPVKIFLIQFFAFLSIMIIAVKVDIDEIERLTAIVAPWFFISIMLAVDSQWENFKHSFQVALVAGLILWTSYTIARGVSNGIQWHHGNCVSVELKE